MTTLKAFFTAREWKDRPYLISPFFDGMLAGGLALLAFPLLFLLYPLDAPDMADKRIALAAVTGVIALIINDPHFMISYQLMYRNFGKKLQRFREQKHIYIRYILAGIVVPVVMGTYFLYAIFTATPALIGHGVNVMLMVVGWHYVKQAYGVFIMLSAMKKIYYKEWQKKLFLANSYMMWIFYVVAVVYENNVGGSITQEIWGVKYTPVQLFAVPEWLMQLCLIGFLVLSWAAMIVSFWGKQYSITALIGYGSMYYFLLPASIHPFWILLYPAFHSLQYLMFVYAYKRGEAKETAKSNWLAFCATAVITGALFFVVIPQTLEGFFLNAALPFSAAFILFINIHHYFIDNVIWRKEHSEIAKYLFSR